MYLIGKENLMKTLKSITAILNQRPNDIKDLPKEFPEQIWIGI
jgi:hypothetical protein